MAQLGYLLEIGDMIAATDQPLFTNQKVQVGDDTFHSVPRPLKTSEQRTSVGSTGGMVTDQHHLFFRPYTKEQQPPEITTELDSAKRQLAELERKLVESGNELITAQAQRDEARRLVTQFVPSEAK